MSYASLIMFCDNPVMPEVDIAKLKRLRAAVTSTLDRVPDKSAHGLTPTYNILSQQASDAVPEGLRKEVQEIAPTIQSSGRGPHAIIDSASEGAKAYAHLAALKGWLDAVIDVG